MCMACELLQGLDLEALSPPEGLPRHPLQFPDGLGSSRYADWLPREGAPRAGGLRRYPPPRSNRHWHPEALQNLIPALVSAGTDGVPQLGIAAAAIEDFRYVWAAKLNGQVAPDARFIVALPTPYSLLAGLPPETFSHELLARLEQCVASEIATLVDTVPPEELAVQWDVCGETRVWESRGRSLAAARDLPERLLQSFVALSAAVPPQAEIGWHFCNRGVQGTESSEAHDSAQVTRLAGAIIASTDREPAFVHIPVPAGRDDAGYYTPLANLGLWPAMDVYLGLVHEGDDVEAAWRRLFAASSVLGRVGIAPACGADPSAVRLVLEQLLRRAAGDVPPGD